MRLVEIFAGSKRVLLQLFHKSQHPNAKIVAQVMLKGEDDMNERPFCSQARKGFDGDRGKVETRPEVISKQTKPMDMFSIFHWVWISVIDTTGQGFKLEAVTNKGADRVLSGIPMFLEEERVNTIWAWDIECFEAKKQPP
ncbi:hypothetical protein ACH5RR_004156 [Cinchona calisaya]|uniref:Uncharacterized protein n=1 Tax=Cinchona calisaya TaxID=153742 RepID=A0ABD3AWV7_9GENT